MSLIISLKIAHKNRSTKEGKTCQKKSDPTVTTNKRAFLYEPRNDSVFSSSIENAYLKYADVCYRQMPLDQIYLYRFFSVDAFIYCRFRFTPFVFGIL